MEIHTPERPPLSMKEFGIQLATITIGILIALSLEGVTQWLHHRSLVREARANLASKLDERALREWRQQILTSLSHLQAEVNFGKSLSAEYAKVLEQP